MQMQPAERGSGERAERLRRFTKAPDAVLVRKISLHRKPRRAPARVPVVRHVCADEHEIARLEKLDVIGHKTRARAALDQRQLHRAMIMPVVAVPLNLPRAPAADDGHAIHTADPAEQAEGLVGGETDVFELGGHGWHHWPDSTEDQRAIVR